MDKLKNIPGNNKKYSGMGEFSKQILLRALEKGSMVIDPKNDYAILKHK